MDFVHIYWCTFNDVNKAPAVGMQSRNFSLIAEMHKNACSAGFVAHALRIEVTRTPDSPSHHLSDAADTTHTECCSAVALKCVSLGSRILSVALPVCLTLWAGAVWWPL